MLLRSNGGEMFIYHKAVVADYIKDVWFYKTAINNIFSLKNLTQQYRVTYDRFDQMFIVHRKKNNKPNIHFRMHDSGLHFYDSAKDFTFVTIISDNRKHYSKQNIKAAERTTYLYRTVTYPSVAD